ncbi:type IV toxin-antitoxin system AbiEi family antitoxin domain-containing protein [Microtetraspora malaysiensis]|uniref:type IV toxin-antitoxin system AbiEi family antitoxin domain-containing protein n=1 Tax=Microtetraspora malaysiensis TaxID=161358 RepID=UPI000831FC87|nr:type IV toxin-antitoxin system AbiEi family antitoxin domain-containing protein [Microtetraspora malaysiensis]
MSLGNALGSLSALAEAQYGLVTTRQAERSGAHRRDLSRLVATGALDRLAHGVYRVAGAPRPSLEELRAAWLQLAPALQADQRGTADGVVSHSSAALVYDVGLLDPLRWEFIIPPPRRFRPRRHDVVIHRAPLTDDDVQWHDGLYVTNPCRTVSDLASIRFDGGHLGLVAADMLERELAHPDDLAAALAPHASAYGLPDAAGQEFLRHLTDR